MHNQLCTLICCCVCGGAHMWWALYWTEPASLQESFVFPISQTPQEGICRPKKVIRSTKFCRSDLDFFESPGLHHWPQKLKFWENIKTALRYYPLKHVYHKWMSYDVCLPQMTIICMVSEKWNMTGVMSCHFGLFFAFYTLPLEILSF